MMNRFLQIMRRMPLTLPACEIYLLQTAIATASGMITIDDWVYLVHLMTYRVTSRLSADERSKELCAKTLREIVKDKDSLGSKFN